MGFFIDSSLYRSQKVLLLFLFIQIVYFGLKVKSEARLDGEDVSFT